MGIQKNELGLYRLIYDKEQKDWVISRDNSERASKRCGTKREALKYLKSLSDNQDVGTVIHKRNGKWQKKTYKKKCKKSAKDKK